MTDASNFSTIKIKNRNSNSKLKQHEDRRRNSISFRAKSKWVSSGKRSKNDYTPRLSPNSSKNSINAAKV